MLVKPVFWSGVMVLPVVIADFIWVFMARKVVGTGPVVVHVVRASHEVSSQFSAAELKLTHHPAEAHFTEGVALSLFNLS